MAQIKSEKEKNVRVNSPEQLNDYIRTSNPRAWLVVIAAIILLVSVLIWGIFGVLDTSVTAGGAAQGDRAVCYLADAESIQPGDKVRMGELEGEVVSVSDKPVSDEQIRQNFSADEYTLYCLNLNEWSYVVEVSLPGNTCDGYVEVEIITESINPISFILG